MLMPFVVCASQGGPFDDGSFVAGYQLGELDMALKIATQTGANQLSGFFPEATAPQLDLIAMSRGFVCEIDSAPTEGWVEAVFDRAID